MSVPVLTLCGSCNPCGNPGTVFFARQLLGFSTFNTGAATLGSTLGQAAGRYSGGDSGVYRKMDWTTISPSDSGSMTLANYGSNFNSAPGGGGVFEFIPPFSLAGGVATSQKVMVATAGTATVSDPLDLNTATVGFIADCLLAIDAAKDACFNALVYNFFGSVFVNAYGFKDCAYDFELLNASTVDPLYLVYPSDPANDNNGHVWRQAAPGSKLIDNDGGGATSPWNPLHIGLIGVFGSFTQFDGSVVLNTAQNLSYSGLLHTGDPYPGAYGVFGGKFAVNDSTFQFYNTDAMSNTLAPRLSAPISFAVYETPSGGTGMLTFGLSRVSTSTKYIFVTWVLMADMLTVTRPTVQEFTAPGSTTLIEIPIPDIAGTFPATSATSDPQSGDSFAGDLFDASLSSIASRSLAGDDTLPAGLITVMHVGMNESDWIAAGSPYLP